MSPLLNLLTIFAGMAGMYIALALLASFLHERIAAWTELRSKTLLTGIEQLLGDKDAASIFASSIVQTLGEPKPSVAGNAAAVRSGPPAGPASDTKPDLPRPMWRAVGLERVRSFVNRPIAEMRGSNRRAPSYIPARQFALATVDCLTKARTLQRAQMRADATAFASDPAMATQAVRDEITRLDNLAANDDDFATRLSTSEIIDDTLQQPTVDQYEGLSDIAILASSPAGAPGIAVEAVFKAAKALLTNEVQPLPQRTANVLRIAVGGATQTTQQFATTLQDNSKALRDAIGAEILTGAQRAALERILASEGAKQDAFYMALSANASNAAKDVADTLARLPDSPMRTALLAIWKTAESDLGAFNTGIQTWFDDHMDRVSGWYKRSTQAILFWIGVALAVAFNVDSIAIFQSLNGNAALARQAAIFASSEQEGQTSSGMVSPNLPCARVAPDAGEKADECACPLGYDSALSTGPLRSEGNRADRFICQLNADVLASLPLGWTAARFGAIYGPHANGWTAFVKLLGLVLTSVAVMLGAPFWFDVLSTVTTVRSAGVRPESANSVKASSLTR